MKYFKHTHALVAEEAQIGKETRIWAFANIQPHAVIGDNCNICDGSFVEGGAVIGNHVTIKHHVTVFNGITIGDDVFVASNVAFINDRYPRSHHGGEWVLEKTIIEKGVTLGSNSVILCGVTVGAYAVIGAGCVVTKNVAAHTIVCGNPGKVKGYACSCGKPLDETSQCVCGKKYVMSREGLKAHE